MNWYELNDMTRRGRPAKDSLEHSAHYIPRKESFA